MFLDTPFIPDGDVTCALVDERMDAQTIKFLTDWGIECITVGRCQQLYQAVCSHPDIMFHPIYKDNIVVAPNADEETIYKLKRKGFKIIKGKKELKRNYPDNIAYNVARLGNLAIHNTKYTDPVLKTILLEMGVEFIDVKQGYAKCSVCIINEKALITSDRGIAAKLTQKNIDVLLIDPGFIEIEGMDYGFIGGATGLVAKDKIFFSGGIEKHPNYEQITKFLNKHKKRDIFIRNKKLYDYGSIIPLTQNKSKK
ncbi:MAG: hypothetical protein PHP06_01965 [Clostridia bacterium]|nr:hypothetical protein [Clostridia bacterium]